MQIPKTTGACIDKLYKLRETIKAENKRISDIVAKESRKVNKTKKEYEELEEHLLSVLRKEKATGGQGKTAKVTLKKTSKPNIEDRAAIAKWMNKTGNYQLMGTVSSPAFKELTEEGVKVPGISKFTTTTLSLNKLTVK